MSPKTADPAIKDALVEAAARLIAAHEPLTTRRLAAEVGTSTMAVYTHFGSMEELRRAVRREGFERLAEHISRVPRTDDALADLVRLGTAYSMNAIENPNLYRVMFMETSIDQADAEVGLYTFQSLVDAMDRAIKEKRFIEADPYWLATQSWTAIHGVAALHVAGLIDVDTVARVAEATARALFLSFGASREEVDRAFAAADLAETATS